MNKTKILLSWYIFSQMKCLLAPLVLNYSLVYFMVSL